MFSSDLNNYRIHFYSLTDPLRPKFLTTTTASAGIHTITFAPIGGKRYVFAAKFPPDPQLLIYDVSSLVP